MVSRFCVVMSVYGGDDPTFFLQAVDSVLNQTMPPSEFIISVDGPVDLSMEAALIAVKKNPIVRLLRLPKNHGPGFARHAAIMLARHDVVAVMDSDDISLPTRFERQVRYLISTGFDIVGGFIEEFDKVPGDLHKTRKVPVAHGDIMRFGKWRQPMNHVTIMFRRKVYMSVGGYHALRSIEDYDLIYRLLLGGARFANIPEVLVYVRTGASVITRRSGLIYLRRELALIHRMKRDGFLATWQWVLSSLLRIGVRLSPYFFIKPIYRLLRK
jgi:glycosyltransferase involved in cell wall biosynthesis